MRHFKTLFIVSILLFVLYATKSYPLMLIAYGLCASVYICARKYGVAEIFVFFSLLTLSLMGCLSISNMFGLGMGIITCSVPALIIASFLTYLIIAYKNEEYKKQIK